MGDYEQQNLYFTIKTNNNLKSMNLIEKAEGLKQPNLPQKLRERIVRTGEVSPDGAILRFKELNRKVDVGLLKETADFMTSWISQQIPPSELAPEKTTVVVVESSGNMLAGFVAERLNLPVVIIKKGKPATMFGEILGEEIHSFTRQTPTIISVEERDIADKKLVVIDDFAATGDTLKAVERMAEQANSEIVAIAVAVSKPDQGSREILNRILSLSVVTIEEMTPATAAEPARIKFVGMPEQTLVRRWGEG